MRFLKRLFGGVGGEAPAAVPAAAEEHEGFLLQATPYQEGGQWQMCGVIAKEGPEGRREHRFVRADRFATQEEAARFTLLKARQIVDQLGEGVFGPPPIGGAGER